VIKPNSCLVLFASEDLCVFVWDFLSSVGYKYCIELTAMLPIYSRSYLKQFGKNSYVFHNTRNS
jgi:hypothetical protein